MSKKTKRVAVLDENRVLVGVKEVDETADGIDIGDLPTNGSYKHDEKRGAFIPLGFGFGKVNEGHPPYSTEFVLASMIEAMPIDQRPGPAIEWLKWFNSDLRKREAERTRARSSKG